MPSLPRAGQGGPNRGWGGSMIVGGFSVITHGTLSEPVEGRGVSHQEMRGERALFAKARSRTEGLEILSNGKRV